MRVIPTIRVGSSAWTTTMGVGCTHLLTLPRIAKKEGGYNKYKLVALTHLISLANHETIAFIIKPHILNISWGPRLRFRLIFRYDLQRTPKITCQRITIVSPNHLNPCMCPPIHRGLGASVYGLCTRFSEKRKHSRMGYQNVKTGKQLA